MARYGGASQAHIRARAVGGTQARIAAAALRDSGRFAEAVQLLEPYTARNPDYQELALLYYGLAGIARAWGDDDLRLYYLAESSVADLRAGTRSYASLYDLALLLFDRKDYDRAAAYMGSASDDAMHCRSMVRIPVSLFRGRQDQRGHLLEHRPKAGHDDHDDLVGRCLPGRPHRYPLVRAVAAPPPARQPPAAD